MPMMLEFEKLYELYAEDADLETTMLYFEKEAAARRIPDDVRDAAIAEVFMEMASGKKFSTDFCDCTPDCAYQTVKWSSAHMNHYTLLKMIEKGGEIKRAHAEILLRGVNTALLSHIKEENAVYLAKKMARSWATSWNKSEILRIIKRLFSFRKSWIVKGVRRWL